MASFLSREADAWCDWAPAPSSPGTQGNVEVEAAFGVFLLRWPWNTEKSVATVLYELLHKPVVNDSGDKSMENWGFL